MGRGEGGRRIGSVSERIELHVSLGVQNQIGWQARTNVHRDTGRENLGRGVSRWYQVRMPA